MKPAQGASFAAHVIESSVGMALSIPSIPSIFRGPMCADSSAPALERADKLGGLPRLHWDHCLDGLTFQGGHMKKKHSVLVVDDEPGIVESLAHMLRRDYEVHAATSASEAFDVMQNHEIHIIMTDQRMPFMTGVELLSKLKGKYPDAIRILFTGFADVEAVIAAINQGNVFRYLAKLWEPEELRQTIQAAAEEYDRIVTRREVVEKLRSAAMAFGNEAIVAPSLISAVTAVMSKQCECWQNEGRESVAKCVRTISDESERLTKLVASAMDVMMCEGTPVEAPPEDFPLREVVEPLQGQLAPIL